MSASAVRFLVTRGIASLLVLLLAGSPAEPQEPSGDWLVLAEQSVAVVTAVVAEPALSAERPDARSPIQQLQPDGRVRVHLPPAHEYVAGHVIRFAVESVAKSDGRVAPAQPIEVFTQAMVAGFEPGERYLLFLDAPIRLSLQSDAVDGWLSLYGVVLVDPETGAETAFDPGPAYSLTPYPELSEARAALEVTPLNAGFVAELLDQVRADTAPRVELTAPADGAVLQGVASLNATASDDVAVVGVQFRLDGTDLGPELPAATSASYAAQWDTAAASDGPHTLSAIARDAVGNTTESRAVLVVVDNAPPSLSIQTRPRWLSPRQPVLVPFSVAVTVSDSVAPEPDVRLVSITCERCDPAADIADAEIGTDDREFRLRSAGYDGSAPSYLITYSATDTAGNAVTATATVGVEPALTPLVECVAPGGRRSMIAFFGYANATGEVVVLPIGVDNRFFPGPLDQGQPTVFQTGRSSPWPRSAAAVPLRRGLAVWLLDGRAAIASRATRRCPGPQPTATGLPGTRAPEGEKR